MTDPADGTGLHPADILDCGYDCESRGRDCDHTDTVPAGWDDDYERDTP